MDRQQTIKTLNDLIETCKDGESGFRSTAEHADSEAVQQVLRARAEECRQAAQELQAVVAELGGRPQGSGTVSGAAHRGWVAVKGTLAGYSDVSMLEEAEHGEDIAMDRYQAALASDLPPEVRLIVMRQYEGVKHNHLQIRTLRNKARDS